MLKFYSLLSAFLFTGVLLNAQCAAQQEFSYNFDDFTDFPSKCWSASRSYPNAYISNDGSGGKGVQIYSNENDFGDLYIVTPEVSTIDGNHKLSFDLSAPSRGKFTVQVGIMKTQTGYNDFIPVGTPFEVTSAGTFTSEAAPATAGYKYVALKITASQTHIAILLDNVAWKSNMSTSDLEAKQVKVYPNPVQNTLHISSIDNVLRYEVMNLAGQVVTSGKESTINVESLPKGVYFVKVYLENNTVLVKKVLKK